LGVPGLDAAAGQWLGKELGSRHSSSLGAIFGPNRDGPAGKVVGGVTMPGRAGEDDRGEGRLKGERGIAVRFQVIRKGRAVQHRLGIRVDENLVLCSPCA
jgi:hypothetical protein